MLLTPPLVLWSCMVVSYADFRGGKEDLSFVFGDMIRYLCIYYRSNMNILDDFVLLLIM